MVFIMDLLAFQFQVDGAVLSDEMNVLVSKTFKSSTKLGNNVK
jgi:hypothetical protein